MYGSPPARDLNRPYGHLKEETDIHRQSQHQMSSGLLRYRSAPSSLFGDVACEDFLSTRPASPQETTETMFARFLNQDKPPQPPPQPIQRTATADETAFSSLYQQPQQVPLQQQAANLAGSNLIRQSSSPAGFYSSENGYGIGRGIGGGTRLKSQLSFSSRQSSAAAAMMSQISEEMESESMEGYPVGSWEESSLLSDNFYSGGGLKRSRESHDVQNGDVRNGLAHQFSLPKTSSEMSAIEKFMQFQDSVPCKIRAKRGCATHPRSIAERVRRTRISERMRKLQELVPNMDKQTNTADMLDLAVDYIKELQKQVNSISSTRANCTCSSSRQKS